MPERPGGRFKRRQKADVGMPLVHRAELAQRVELVRWAIAALGHDGVEDRAGVALREQETIAVFPLGVGRIVAHHVEE